MKKSKYRKLTLEEQIILKYIMHRKQLSLSEIARQNNLTSPTNLFEVWSGKRNVSPTMKRHFLRCGINLDDIMAFSGPTHYYKPGRILTEKEAKILRDKCKELGITQKDIAKNAYTSRGLINTVFRRYYKVTNIIKEHFLKSGIDLDEIMGEK